MNFLQTNKSKQQQQQHFNQNNNNTGGRASTIIPFPTSVAGGDERRQVNFNSIPSLLNEILPRYRRDMVRAMNERVQEMDVDLSCCEEDWLSTHLLKRSYQNKQKYLLTRGSLGANQDAVSVASSAGFSGNLLGSLSFSEDCDTFSVPAAAAAADFVAHVAPVGPVGPGAAAAAVGYCGKKLNSMN
ncbi:hypothetical protein BD770DRAFT_477839 [Pilaira anomala]|nr:hypothetical protein BD770DRAFT_477839 [Pilaira anomala]